MTDKEIKEFCKFIIEYGNRTFSRDHKEALKLAVDQSKNWQELLMVAIIGRMKG